MFNLLLLSEEVSAGNAILDISSIAFNIRSIYTLEWTNDTDVWHFFGSSLDPYADGHLYSNGSIALAGLGGVLPVLDARFSILVADDALLHGIPAPATLPLFLSAIGVLGFMGWRKRRV